MMPPPRPTPSIAWSLVHEQDVPMRQAAERLGISVSELLGLLATYCPPNPPKPPPRPVPPPPAPAPSHPAGRKRVDVAQAWRAADAGSTAAQIAAAMGFSKDGIDKALLREAIRRRCLPPTAVAPRPPTRAEIAWDLVHGQGLDVRTVGRRLGLQPPAVLGLLAEQTPVVREREWTELTLAGEDPGGRADWSSQHDEHLRRRVSALAAESLPTVLIAERLGLSSEAAWRLVHEVRRSPSP